MMANNPNKETLRVAADWWVRLRDPAASERTMEQWMAWTAEDPSHLTAFERVTELAMRLAALGEVSRARLLAEFAPSQAARFRWQPWAAAAAVVLVAGGVAGWLLLGGQVQTQQYSSAVAGTQDVTLADGSRISLGGATRVTTRFGRGLRQVELAEGEVYLEVAHNPQRPFVVQAGKLTIRDIGTAFDVRRTGDLVTVTMAEGRVRIYQGANGDDAGLDAVAGQAVSYDPARPAMKVSSADPAEVAAWRDSRLEFDNEPLSVVVANINRYSKRPLRIVDADLAPMTFTGTVRTDAIEEWLRALPKVLPLRVSEEGGQLLLSDAAKAPAGA
ncbi:FecR domain-containing protein [Dyella sp. C9]|uniref:FecR family protein n=1 Tax=Dyella sp. C9 TaxID=2202154 RepID=UPI0018E52E19|nr:FecR domain-containing protein [Dyella sp. C9]